MIAGIVLAAGQSTRMGTLKQLLPLGGRTVIEAVARTVASRLEKVVVVVGYRAEEVQRALSGLAVECAFNEQYHSGMLSSVQCGLQAAPQARAYLICLGDQPSLKGEVIDRVLEAATQTGKGIAVPTYQGRRGHPVLISAAYRSEILALSAGQGLNAVTRGHPEDTCEVPMDRPQVLEDLDTPQDYQRELARTRGDAA
jgi:molybdenum cofactor cytidylyltransferase